MNFVDELPPDGRSRGARAIDVDVAVLRANPGRWAEAIRLPVAKRNAASGRGRHFVSLHAGTEYVTRTVGDEIVVFVRAVPR